MYTYKSNLFQRTIRIFYQKTGTGNQFDQQICIHSMAKTICLEVKKYNKMTYAGDFKQTRKEPHDFR